MKKLFFWATGCFLLFACQNNGANKPTTNDSTGQGNPALTPAPIEFADSTYSAIGQKALTDFAKADYDAVMSVYTDDSRLYLANGDSVIGKPNITKFWKNTMAIADSIRFVNPIFLPLKVNESKQVATGTYLMIWFDYNLFLKKGKKLFGRSHEVVHMTADKKTDFQIYYSDNAPLMAAMKMKK
jgi:ketosteroid isomerase-like protein